MTRMPDAGSWITNVAGAVPGRTDNEGLKRTAMRNDQAVGRTQMPLKYTST